MKIKKKKKQTPKKLRDGNPGKEERLWKFRNRG